VERRARDPLAALTRLDEITRRLRRECPWDREQDERSIVPHTVEEAYELADAAQAGDDARMLDELGDVLFQVYFLALLLEERGAGDLAGVAERCREKLIRRHPHVFAGAEATDAAAVRRRWDEIKRDEEGAAAGSELFARPRESLPATLYAKKAWRRAAAASRRPVAGKAPDASPLDRLPARADQLGRAAGRDERFEAAGELLLAAVEAVVDLDVDPELALRAAVDRFVARVEATRAAT
jgi:MazG family protein